MRLRIGQRQRRAPGAADDHPAFEAEFFADHLHVRDQMRQRVVVAAAPGSAAAGAALVEQHRMKAFGIEQPAMIGLASAAGPAMQIDRGDAAGAADALDIDIVAVADRRAVPTSAAQTDRRVLLDFPASASGAMLAFRLQRAAGEIAIEETVAGRRRPPVSACLKICSCIGDSVQAGSVLPASPVSAKAWQRQPPKSISRNSQLLQGSFIQPVPR